MPSCKRKQPTRKQRKQTRKFTMKKMGKGGSIYDDESGWNRLNDTLATKLNNYSYKQIILTKKRQADAIYDQNPNSLMSEELLNMYNTILSLIELYEQDIMYLSGYNIYIPNNMSNDVVKIIFEAININKGPSDYFREDVKNLISQIKPLEQIYVIKYLEINKFLLLKYIFPHVNMRKDTTLKSIQSPIEAFH